MLEPCEILKEIQRPSLLIRAARLGAKDYSRNRELRRIIPGSGYLSPEKAVPILLEEEEALEAIRRCGDASYSAVRHVRVMIALLAEVKLLQNGVNAPK